MGFSQMLWRRRLAGATKTSLNFTSNAHSYNQMLLVARTFKAGVWA
jgi:hypothetical protein